MNFEFDKNQSCSNLEKHGIDFKEAQLLWGDDELIEVRVNHEGEPRYIVIGIIDEKFWTAVITYRGENVRIISVRRSRKAEVKLYES